MKKATLSLLVLGLLVAYFGHRNRNLPKQRSSSVVASSEKPSTLFNDVKTPYKISNDARAETSALLALAVTCAQQGAGDELIPIIEKIFKEPKGASIDKYLLFSNVHFELANGDRRRLQLSADSTADGKHATHLRFFSETDEGFPWPIKLPKEHEWNPSKEVIDLYKAVGKVVFEQTSWQTQGRQSPIEWTETNGRLQDLTASFQYAELSCSTDQDLSTCHCEGPH